MKSSCNRIPLSVVIPTLGGDVLYSTLRSVAESDKHPAEILICIPKSTRLRPDIYKHENIQIIETLDRGQVQQRGAGFMAANQPFVLQLDDDLLLSGDDMAKMVAVLQEMGPQSALGPGLVLAGTNQPWSWFPRTTILQVIQGLAVSFLHGGRYGRSRMGKIARTGWSFSVDYRQIERQIMEVEWLPGGCVLHHRSNLITENYYPFAGKAYGEDLIMSHLLRTQGIRLWVTSAVLCGIRPDVKGGSLPVRVRRMTNRIRVRISVSRLCGVGAFAAFYAAILDTVGSLWAVVTAPAVRVVRNAKSE